MAIVIVDAEILAKLRNLAELLELYDTSGKLLATVEPAAGPSRYIRVEPQISEEEIERRKKSDTWHTTDEVLEHLKKSLPE